MNKSFFLLKFFFLILFCGQLTSANDLPEGNVFISNLIQLDNLFTHHVMVVEKSTHNFYLFKNDQGRPVLAKKFKIATGKSLGNKQVEGDHKTPEGIYHLTQFYSKDELFSRYKQEARIYGAGAFQISYPNIIDQLQGKTGGGIWLHSTDDDSRIDKKLESRGCVVVVDQDLKEISEHIDLRHTPIIIVQDLNFFKESTWKISKDGLQGMVNSWLKSWQQKDFNRYISFYSEKNFKDKVRGRFSQFKNYKKSIFSRPDQPRIETSHLSILQTQDYAVVHFVQDYRSNTINDKGKKTLYLMKDENYQWKIIAELWSKLDKDLDYKFFPDNRFFKN